MLAPLVSPCLTRCIRSASWYSRGETPAAREKFAANGKPIRQPASRALRATRCDPGFLRVSCSIARARPFADRSGSGGSAGRNGSRLAPHPPGRRRTRPIPAAASGWGMKGGNRRPWSSRRKRTGRRRGDRDREPPASVPRSFPLLLSCPLRVSYRLRLSYPYSTGNRNWTLSASCGQIRFIAASATCPLIGASAPRYAFPNRKPDAPPGRLSPSLPAGR